MTTHTEDLRCPVIDEHGLGRCTLDRHDPGPGAIHAWEGTPGPLGPPQRWQATARASVRTSTTPSEEAQAIQRVKQVTRRWLKEWDEWDGVNPPPRGLGARYAAALEIRAALAAHTSPDETQP